MSHKFIVANWKMNGSYIEIQSLIKSLSQNFRGYESYAPYIVICPPLLYAEFVLNRLAELGWKLGAQDCSAYEKGAYTGQISAAMLRDIGCQYVIIGHSERRNYNHEDDILISDKIQQCLKVGLIPIICVGENLKEYDNRQTLEVVQKQLVNALSPTVLTKTLLIAYEPVWSIGTGRVPTPDEIEQVHAHIKQVLNQIAVEKENKIPILYGGSVNSENVISIMKISSVDGVLIGGASLKAADFTKIIEAANIKL